MNDNGVKTVDPYRYDKADRLGKGGYGTVYKGHHDHKPNQPLAIKRIEKTKVVGDKFKKEIEIMQALSAPEVDNDHLVILLDYLETEKYVYLVMELCNGGSFDRFLKDKKGKLDEESIRVFLRQMASGLKVLQDNGIVHRDLKPENILLSHTNGTTNVSDITFKIADFGVGKFLAEGSKTQTFIGTPVFMAPEIFVHGTQYDYKVDLWSIGCIVYQCLTGTLFDRFSNDKPKFPKNTNSDLQDLLTGLLKKEPKERMDFSAFYQHPFIGLAQQDEKMMGTSDNIKPKRASAADLDWIWKTSFERRLSAFILQSSNLTKGDSIANSDNMKTIPKDNQLQKPAALTDPLSAKGLKDIFAKLLKTLVVGNGDFCAVAQLNGRIHVLSRSPNAIISYSNELTFHKIKEIQLDEYVKCPQDIAACPTSNCYYVTDSVNGCIWKVSVGCNPRVLRWVSGGVSAPHTLSVSHDGHVLTFGNNSRTLDVYGPDAVIINRVQLPGEVKDPRHAVKTSNGNFIVSHEDVIGKKLAVCEISQNGNINRRYEQKMEMANHAAYLAIDPVVGLFWLDGGINRVLQLDSQLRVEQVLSGADRGMKPFRICVASVRGTRQLLVQYQSGAVDIYNLP